MVTEEATGSTTSEATVVLSIPVGADLLVLARFTAAAMGERAGLDLGAIEDLRLAVDELCVSVVQNLDEGRLTIEYRLDDDAVEVSCRYASVNGAAAGLEESALRADLSDRILDALVDGHGQDRRDGYQHAWLRKRRSQP